MTNGEAMYLVKDLGKRICAKYKDNPLAEEYTKAIDILIKVFYNVDLEISPHTYSDEQMGREK